MAFSIKETSLHYFEIGNIFREREQFKTNPLFMSETKL